MGERKKKKYFLVSSLEKGLKVIDLLSQHGKLTVTQLAKLMKMDTSASHRFLSTLKELDYVEKNHDGSYQLTFKLLSQGMKVADRFEIRGIAKPYMQRLSKKYGQNINLAYFDGTCLTQIDQIQSRDIFKLDPGIGTQIPIHATGLGKAILADLPDADVGKLLAEVALSSFGPNTITNLSELKKEIELSRKNGFATDDEELALGLRCIAASIKDANRKPVYAISISGPTFNMKNRYHSDMGQELISCCKEISTVLLKSGKVAAPVYYKIEPGTSESDIYKPWAFESFHKELVREKVKKKDEK